MSPSLVPTVSVFHCSKNHPRLPRSHSSKKNAERPRATRATHPGATLHCSNPNCQFHSAPKRREARTPQQMDPGCHTQHSQLWLRDHSVHDGFHMLVNVLTDDNVVLCVQDVRADDFPSQTQNEPFVYHGPVGSRRRETGFLVRNGVTGSTLPPTLGCLRANAFYGDPNVFYPHFGLGRRCAADDLIVPHVVRFLSLCGLVLVYPSRLPFSKNLFSIWGCTSGVPSNHPQVPTNTGGRMARNFCVPIPVLSWCYRFHGTPDILVSRSRRSCYSGRAGSVPTHQWPLPLLLLLGGIMSLPLATTLPLLITSFFGELSLKFRHIN